jgi:hypothetical protein
VISYVLSVPDTPAEQRAEAKLPFSGLQAVPAAAAAAACLLVLLSGAAGGAAISVGQQPFTSLQDLLSSAKQGIYLQESGIPLMEKVALNAWAYDFYSHGSMAALEIENRLKRQEIWELCRR